MTQICDYKLPFLRVNAVPCCLGIELGLIRQYFRKARGYVRANASVPTAGAIDEAVAKVKLERRYASQPPPPCPERVLSIALRPRAEASGKPYVA